MTRWWHTLALFAVFALLTGGPVLGCGESRASGYAATPQTRELARGGLSGVDREVEAVFRDPEAWRRFYAEHAPEATAPAVDFGSEMVLAVVQPRNTGGYSVSFDGVRDDGGTVVATYTERRPSADAVVIQVLTQPYVFVAVPRMDGPVRFEHRVETAPTP